MLLPNAELQDAGELRPVWSEPPALPPIAEEPIEVEPPKLLVISNRLPSIGDPDQPPCQPAPL